jgi:glycine/D-amino acid oxidase-like deaminating enzyme
MVRSHESVIIIGGGIAGLACARRLHDAGHSALLITEDLGGRIRTSTDGAVNIGYSHVNRFVDRGPRLKRRPILRGAEDGSFSRSDLPLILHLPQTLRFSRLIRQFRRHYEAFKSDCEVMSQAEAIRAEPLLWELYNEPAPDFILRNRIEDIARSHLALYAQGTAFASFESLSAFTLLVVLLPTIVPIFEYSFRFDALMAEFEDSLLFETVTRLTHSSDGYLLHTHGGETFTADNVVVATPIDVSARLLGLDEIKAPMDAHLFVLRGSLRRPWSRATFSLFPENDDTFAMAQQPDGQILFASASEHPDFSRFFETWEVVDHHHWDPAFQLGGSVLLECEQGPGLYLIGDHNVCTLEDSFITGNYAANRILAAD